MNYSKIALPLLLGSTLLSPAIERPGKNQNEDLPPLASEKTQDAQTGNTKDNAASEQEAKPWLGVGGTPVGETLAWHLNLDGGVLLQLVAPDSPAAKSGLEARDIITSVDGQAVDSQNSLRAAILKHEAGEEVALGLVQRGKDIKKKVKLGDRPDNIPGSNFPRFGQNRQALPQGIPDALRKEIERKMHNLRQPELRLGGGDFNHLEQRLNKLLQDMPDAGGKQPGLNFKMHSSVTFKDDQGSVELDSRNGGKEVTIRDKDGTTVFEGPYDTEQDKSAVPDIYQERLKKLNLEERGVHFKLKGLEPQQDTEKEGKDKIQ